MAKTYIDINSYNPNIGPYFKTSASGSRLRGKKLQFKKTKQSIILQGWTKLTSSGSAVLIYDILPYIKALVIPLNSAYNAIDDPSFNSSVEETTQYMVDYNTNYAQHLQDWYCQCTLSHSNSSFQSAITLGSYNHIGGGLTGTAPKILLNDGFLWDSNTFLSSLMRSGCDHPYTFDFTVFESLSFSGYHNGYAFAMFGYQPFTGWLHGTSFSKTEHYTHETSTANFYVSTDIEATRNTTVTARFNNGLFLGGQQLPIIIANDINAPMKYKTTDKVFYLDDYTAYPFNSGTTWSNWISNADYKNVHNIFKSSHFSVSGTDVVFLQEPFNISPAPVYSNAACITKVKSTDTIVADKKYYTIKYDTL